MPTNFSHVVQRVNAANPTLLQWNSKSSCGEFLQLVCNEPECKAEHVGLLSKHPPENLHTFPNGVQTAVDVLAWPTGERVDIISSAGGHPAPGGPTWQVIPPDQWRPSNVYVSIAGWPIYPSDAPGEIPTAPFEVGFGWFCWMRAWADWPEEAAENERWILGEINPQVYRVMLAVEGQSHVVGTLPDPWRDAGVTIGPEWEDRYKAMLDHIGGQGRQVHATVYGGRNQTPTSDSRKRFNDRIVAASAGRWSAIRSFEMANEYKVNQWTAPEVREMGRDLRSKLPAGFRLALSSPDAALPVQPTNEQMQAAFDELYGGSDHGGASEITIHTFRDGGKWSDPYSYNIFTPQLPKVNNEPPGPGTSAGGEQTDAVQVEQDLTRSKGAAWVAYWGHSEWCVWNGHLPREYDNGYREVRHPWELPHMPACARVLKNGSTSPEPPDVPIPPYDENWITATVIPSVTEMYESHGVPLDDQYPVWVARIQYDVDAGMSQEASLAKHLAELDQALP